MPQQDTSGIKQKIISLLKEKGPTIPVHIAREIEMDLLFTSAFLSELLSEKKVKISNMKVGNSPIYYIEGQEPQLENFSHYLKSKEKEAYSLLKENKFLKDKEQEPAIRVALRQLKDFAVPFRDNEEIMWRFFTIPEQEFKQKQKEIPEQIQKPQKETMPEQTQQAERLNIFDDSSKKEIPETKKQTKKKTKKRPQKNDKFFNKVKEYLSKKQIEIIDIEEVTKNSLTLKVKDNENEYLLIAYNKKRLSEEEINKAYKKASELGMPYKILGLGEPLKRVDNLIKAIRELEGIEKIE